MVYPLLDAEYSIKTDCQLQASRIVQFLHFYFCFFLCVLYGCFLLFALLYFVPQFGCQLVIFALDRIGQLLTKV